MRRPEGWIGRSVEAFAAVLAGAVVYANTIAFVDAFAGTIVFLSAMLGLVFLVVGAGSRSDRRRPPPVDLLFSALAFASGIYFWVNADNVITRITLLDPLGPADVFFASVLVLLTLEVTRRTVGLGFTVIVLLFLLYNLFGDVLSGALGHGQISYDHFLDIMVFTTDGIFGVPVRVAATYAFLFVLFGTVLAKAGGSEFFFNVAAAISGSRPGGPAKIAVISSGLYGMISGSPTSDVVTTGSITIPVMRRLGYTATLAGGVEVAASTGGSLLPPVMGSAAFIMAEFTGIEYRDIVIAAICPALLFYLGVYAQVHLRSLKMGLTGLDRDQIPTVEKTLRQGGIFLVPLAVIITALLMGYSPTFVAVFGSISVIAVAVFSPATRLGLIDLYQVLAGTTMRMIPVTGACAAAGLVIGGLTMTGLALKFSNLVFLVTGGFPILTLGMAALVTLVLGLGMPTPSAYILAAMLVGPALADLGFSAMAANMFLLYFAVLSAMTPPVAVAAYAASAIASANPIGIAVVAVRLSVVAFVVPFAFIYGEELLLRGDILSILIAGISAIMGVLLLAMAVEGHLRAPLAGWLRLVLAASGICLILPFVETIVVGLVGVVLAAIVRRQQMQVAKMAPK